MKKYTDKEMLAIQMKLQTDQLVLVDRYILNQVYDLVGEILQSVKDTNYGTCKSASERLQAMINELLPVVDKNGVTTSTDSVLDTPIGKLDLKNSTLGNMLKYNEIRELYIPQSDYRRKIKQGCSKATAKLSCKTRKKI